MFLILRPLVPHRVVYHLTLPQLVNLCRRRRYPVRIAIDSDGITFLKEGKVYYRRKDRSEDGVTEVDVPPVHTLSVSKDTTTVLGERFCATVSPYAIRMGSPLCCVKITPPTNVIQMFQLDGTMHLFLDDSGKLYQAWGSCGRPVGCKEELVFQLFPCLHTLPPISHITSNGLGSPAYVDVNNNLWTGNGSVPTVAIIVNEEEDIREELRKRGINTNDVQEIYYSSNKDRVFLVKRDGKIRVIVKHRCKYIVAEENYKHFSY